jgi:hypothetical protein
MEMEEDMNNQIIDLRLKEALEKEKEIKIIKIKIQKIKIEANKIFINKVIKSKNNNMMKRYFNI